MAVQTLTEVAVEVHADLRKLKPEVVAAVGPAGRAGGEALGDGIGRGADNQLRAHRPRFAASGRATGESFGKGFEGSIVTGTFAKTLAVMVSRFAIAGGAAAAAAPGIAQFVGALAPAAGAALALPAALLAIKAASSVVKVAVMGVGDAITAGFGDNAKAASKALDQLTGNARNFAKQVISLRAPVLDLKSIISDRFFLPLLDDVQPLANLYLPMLRREVGNLAGPLGGLAEQLAETGRRGLIFDTVRKVLDQTGLTVIRLRQSINPLATVLAVLVRDTVGELPGLAQGFANASDRLAAFVVQASNAGRITQAFRNGTQVVADFGGILRNVGSIVSSVYGAATANGNTLLGSLRALTGQAAAFFNTAQGGQALAGVFSTLGSLGQALRTGLAAVLPAIAQSIQIVAPALQGLAPVAAQLVVALAPLLPYVAGLTAVVVKALTPALAQLAGWLTRNEQILKVAVVAVIAYGAALRVAAAIAAVQAAGGIAKWVAQTTLATNISRIFTAAQYALGVAMRFALGPVGLVIAAVAALVAGVTYAYRNHEGFRVAVQKVWKDVQAAARTAVEWFVGTALPWMRRTWDSIAEGAVQMWQQRIRPALNALVQFFRDVVAPTAMWLWRNVISPAFTAIGEAVKVGVGVARVAMTVIVAYWRNVVAPVVTWLWRNIVAPAFSAIGQVIKAGMAVGQLALAASMAYFRTFVAPTLMWVWKNVVVPVFNGWKTSIAGMWSFVRPILKAVGDFVVNNVAPAFKTAVTAITKNWDMLKQAALLPVRFVVTTVMNPLIGGFNKLAGVFGTTKIDPIKGFEEGGRIPGNSGGRDDRIAQLMGRGGKLLGSIKVAAGEFVVNARDTARALPLLRWINGGMKGGPMAAAERIGRAPAERPGDGSEGYAFAKGGLVGFLSDIWGAISNPKQAILNPIEAALGAIPGGGMIRGLLVSMGKKLANGFVGWLGGATGGGAGGAAAGGNLGKAMNFIRAQNGKPYGWANAGPGSYDCSGIVSSAWNILHGRSPYSHTFSTASLPGPFFPKRGPGGLLTAGWAHPGQRGASANVGHMAGQFLGGMKFESTGSTGVRVGANARSPFGFAHVGHFAGGGLLPGVAKVARADFGSVTLARGWNMVQNATGRPEPLSTGSGEIEALLRALIAAVEAIAPGVGRAIGASTPGLMREARRR